MAVRNFQDFRDLLLQFWVWWLRELQESLPKSVKDYLMVNSREITLRLRGEKIDIEWVGEEGVEELWEYTFDEIDNELVKKALGPDAYQLLDETKVTLIIGDGEILHHKVTLPLVAEPNLTNVLSYELDRLTPFSPDQMYFGYLVAGRYPEAERLSLDLSFLRRDYLDEILGRLRLSGFSVSAVYPGERLEHPLVETLNLLGTAHRPRRKSLFDSRARMMSMAVIIVALLIGIFPNWQLSRAEKLIREKIANVSIDAEMTAEKRSALLGRIEANKSLATRKGEVAGKLQVIQELTRLLPDSTWVSRLNISGQSVSLQGESDKASDLIEVLDSSHYFKNISFASPVTTNSVTNLQRYEIQMELVSQ